MQSCNLIHHHYCQEKNYKPDTASHLPFALLGEGGMETLSPFVPVEVEKYSEQELDTMIGETTE